MRAKRLIQIVTLVALLSRAAIRAAEPFFIGLENFPAGASNVTPSKISTDGSVVVGSFRAASGTEAFRWSRTEGVTALGDLPGGEFSSAAQDVSADGAVVVGTSQSTLRSEAFRWTQDGGMVGLGDLPGGGAHSAAFGLSADGIVVVGSSSASDFATQAFRWTQDRGMVGLGFLQDQEQSFAYRVSADGSVVIGTGDFEAFRWTQSTGMVGLGDLPGAHFDSQANDVSADGSIVIGESASAIGLQAFRWTQATGMVALGELPGGSFSSQGLAVSADGSIVVGRSSTALGAETFIWDATQGMRNLRDVLEHEFGLGASLSGWGPLIPADISDDGRSIVGRARNPAGIFQPWIAHFGDPNSQPIPGDANNDGTVNRTDLAILVSHHGTAGGATFANGDFDGDARVTLIDALMLQNHLTPSPAAAAIPEPSTLLPALVAALVLGAGCARVSRPRTSVRA